MLLGLVRMDAAKLAGATALSYVVFFISGMFIHYARTGDEYTLYYSLSRPQTWLATIGGVIIGFGLWRHKEWAWWLGILAALFQLFGISSRLVPFLTAGESPPASMLIVAVLLAIFVLLLCLPQTRALCKR
jgi:benzodiazapine receptor